MHAHSEDPQIRNKKEIRLFGYGILVSLMIIDSLQHENRKACSDFPFLMPTKTVLQNE